MVGPNVIRELVIVDILGLTFSFSKHSIEDRTLYNVMCASLLLINGGKKKKKNQSHIGTPLECQTNEHHNPSFYTKKDRRPGTCWEIPEGCPRKVSWFNACFMNSRVAIQREAVEWWLDNTWRPHRENGILSFLHELTISKQEMGGRNVLISSNVQKESRSIHFHAGYIY